MYMECARGMHVFPNLGVRVDADPVCDGGYAVLTPRGVQVPQRSKPALRG